METCLCASYCCGIFLQFERMQLNNKVQLPDLVFSTFQFALTRFSKVTSQTWSKLPAVNYLNTGLGKAQRIRGGLQAKEPWS